MIPLLVAIASLSHPESQSESGPLPAVKPAPLRKKDSIALISPASPLAEAQVQRVVKYFQKKGYTVKLSYGYREADGYLAGSDETRAAELTAMFRDPEVKAIVCLRGGYGSPRILDAIDYGLIRRNPKILVGYSDITALLNAVRARTGLVVFHGPMGKDFSGPGGPPPFSARYFWSAFESASPLLEEWGRGMPGGRESLKTIVGGRAEGVLAGGNLSVLTSTLGTPYEVDTRDAILFLEEVNEKPFRIDRMLNHLRLSGKLAEARGVLLCAFTNCDTRSENGRRLETVFQDYLGRLGVPVLAGFPAGHVADQVTLPMGTRVRLDATARKLTLLEAAVTAE